MSASNQDIIENTRENKVPKELKHLFETARQEFKEQHKEFQKTASALEQAMLKTNPNIIGFLDFVLKSSDFFLQSYEKKLYEAEQNAMIDLRIGKKALEEILHAYQGQVQSLLKHFENKIRNFSKFITNFAKGSYDYLQNQISEQFKIQCNKVLSEAKDKQKELEEICEHLRKQNSQPNSSYLKYYNKLLKEIEDKLSSFHAEIEIIKKMLSEFSSRTTLTELWNLQNSLLEKLYTICQKYYEEFAQYSNHLDLPEPEVNHHQSSSQSLNISHSHNSNHGQNRERKDNSEPLSAMKPFSSVASLSLADQLKTHQQQSRERAEMAVAEWKALSEKMETTQTAQAAQNNAKAQTTQAEQTTQNSAEAQYKLAYEYKHAGLFKEAYELYQSAADQGHIFAQYNLALLLLDDHFDSHSEIHFPKNPVKAFEYFTALADKHDPVLNCLGNCYELGMGTAINYPLAFLYYREAAKHNISEGIYNLARCFHWGIGISQDLEKAQEFYGILLAKGDFADDVCAAMTKVSEALMQKNLQTFMLKNQQNFRICP